MFSIRQTAIAALAAIAFALPATASDEAHLEVRQKVMAAIGADTGAIAAIVKNGLTDHAALIPTLAAAIEANSETVKAVFETDISEGRTDALPSVWENWAGFQAAADKLTEEAGKLAAMDGSDLAAMGAQLKAVGGSCAGCHKEFRKPKDQRFRR